MKLRRQRESETRSEECSVKKMSAIGACKLLARIEQRRSATTSETSLRRSLWGRLSRLRPGMHYMTSGYSTRRPDCSKALGTKMITTFMRSHCSRTAPQQASTKMSTERLDRVIWQLIWATMARQMILRMCCASNLIVVSTALNSNRKRNSCRELSRSSLRSVILKRTLLIRRVLVRIGASQVCLRRELATTD